MQQHALTLRIDHRTLRNRLLDVASQQVYLINPSHMSDPSVHIGSGQKAQPLCTLTWQSAIVMQVRAKTPLRTDYRPSVVYVMCDTLLKLVWSGKA